MQCAESRFHSGDLFREPDDIAIQSDDLCTESLDALDRRLAFCHETLDTLTGLFPLRSEKMTLFIQRGDLLRQTFSLSRDPLRPGGRFLLTGGQLREALLRIGNEHGEVQHVAPGTFFLRHRRRALSGQSFCLDIQLLKLRFLLDDIPLQLQQHRAKLFDLRPRLFLIRSQPVHFLRGLDALPFKQFRSIPLDFRRRQRLRLPLFSAGQCLAYARNRLRRVVHAESDGLLF